MPRNHPHPPVATRLQGVLAGLLGALVLALTLLAAAPALHACLHEHEPAPDHATSAPHPADDDAGCVITLFGHGVTAPLALPQLNAPRLPWIDSLQPALKACAPAAPLHRLPPARGPPERV